MPVAHILLALLVTLIWGLNFVVIKVGLGDFPPLLFCALRFALAALPLLVLRGPMPAPFGRILLIGVLLGVVKFGLLFVGMAQGMPAGLSSLVLQSQVFFTILIAALWLGERPTPRGLFGLLLAAAGLVLIGLERPLGDSLLAFLLVVAAALAWSFANIATKRSGATDMLRLICWVSLVPPLPLLALFLSIRRSASHRARRAEHELGRLRRAALHRLRRDPRWASPSGVSSCATTRPAW
ncbi:membrane protein [Pseudomonas aeruginosa]|nr:membrane protein [Pseudomonas aeruginosa]